MGPAGPQATASPAPGKGEAQGGSSVGGREAAWGLVCLEVSQAFHSAPAPGRAHSRLCGIVCSPFAQASRLRAHGPEGSFWKALAS